MELYTKIRVKNACNEKKIKEENVRSDFPIYGTTCACDTAMVRVGKHPSRTNAVQSAGAIVPADEAPCGMQWHARLSTRAH